MCPIGIGEMLWRINGKTVVSILQKDIMHAAGVTQVCAGHCAGCEATIHALCQVFSAFGTDAVLLVDADNAIASIVQWHCIIFSTSVHHWLPS